MKSGIYKIEHIISGKKYIGSSIDALTRMRKHKEKLNRNEHPNKVLQNAWNKYRQPAFKFSLLLICDKKDLLFYEQKIINVYKSAIKPFGYNIRKNATSNLGIRSKPITYHKGDKYGRWTLIDQQGIGSLKWLCQCECGIQKIIRASSLRQGYSSSCGCYRKEKLAELKRSYKSGDKFGRLTLISLKQMSKLQNGAHRWLCMCDCGKEHVANIAAMLRGKIKSCGCYRKEMLRDRAKKVP